jgi:hypothetical protein
VTRRESDQLALLFSRAKLGRPANNLIQELECLGLFIDKQLGITDHVDEEDVRNFEMKMIRFTLSGQRRRDAELCTNYLDSIPSRREISHAPLDLID